MFHFTPLLGAQSDSSSAVQSLLEFDGGVKILIDVGWDDSFNTDVLQELEKHVSTISLILLTHPTFAHLGAYAHCCKHIPLFSRIPVYATTPVISLGRALLHDVYTSTPLASAQLPQSAYSALPLTDAPSVDNGSDRPRILLPPPTLEDITEYFSTIHPLKFSQSHQPSPSPTSPPLDGLTVTAHSAGHSLGGTIWHIQHGSESVVYAVDWNQARENVLGGAAWLGGATAPGSEVIEQLRHPSALVCSSKRCDVLGSEGGWKTRDETLLGHIRSTLAEGGSVLIPCDSSARVLELAFLLEKAWADDASLQNTPLMLTSHTAGAVMRYARSMLEWMDESVVREFETNAANRIGQDKSKQASAPFDFKFLKLLEKRSKIQRAMAAPGAKVFLASDASLDWGYSREIMEGMASDSKNLIVLPDKLKTSYPSESPILVALRQLLDGSDDVAPVNTTITTNSVQIKPLDASELPFYQQHLARQRQQQAAIGIDRDAALETAAEGLDDASSSSSSSEDSDTELQGKALNTSATMTATKTRLGVTDEELGINVLLRRRAAHDYDTRQRRGRERIYPYLAKRKRNDDFGENIRPDEYLRAEEREDPAGALPPPPLPQDLRGGGRDGARPDAKRAFDVGEGREAKRRKGPGGSEVREAQTNGEAHDGDDQDDEEDSDYEPEEAEVQGPRKAVFSPAEITLTIRAVAIDYSGIHDQRSLNMLIPLIKPRKLILTAGTAAETALLKANCERMLAADVDSHKSSRASEIFAPAPRELVDASVDTNAWSIKLSTALLRSLQWQQVRSLGLATVSGQVQAAADAAQSASKRVKTEAAGGAVAGAKAVEPVLALLPSGVLATERAFAQSVHVGDLRLAELRRHLQTARHTAEFKGEGTLLVDGRVTVRKSGLGRIEIESASSSSARGAVGRRLDASFDLVRRLVYDGLAVVAAR